MVSGLTIACILIAMLVPLGIVIATLIYFLVRHKTGIVPVLIGAGVFLVFALILEAILNNFILVWNKPTAEFFKNTVAYTIYAGLAAGVFEETGRLVGFKLFFKKRQEWKHGIAYGVGHGGLEVIVIGVLAQVNNLIYSMMINNGTFQSFQSTSVLTENQISSLENVRQKLVSLPSWEFLLSGIERIDAFIIQLALSILVLYAVKKHRYWFYALAILIHTLIDSSAVFFNNIGMPNALLEGIITLYAVAAVVFVVLSRKLFKDNEMEIDLKKQTPTAV